MSDMESIKAIQQRMQQVRHDLGDEMGDLMESAKDMTDWRKYVRANPWACMGIAAAVGYLLVPQRAPSPRLDPEDLKALARHTNITMSPGAPAKGGLRAAAVSFIASAAMRGVMAYLGQHVAKPNGEPMEKARRF